jgi:predicted O-methyltransferase YrrM
MKEFNFKWIDHISNLHSIGDVQIKALYQYARECEGNAVEIGSYRGRSTVVIAAGLRHGGKGKVVAIDPHVSKSSDYELFLDNIENTHFADQIIPIRSTSERVFEMKTIQRIFRHPIGLLFIDGDHTYEGVKKDLNWVDVVSKGGIIALHDYTSKYPGIVKAVNEYQETHHAMEQLPLLGSMILFRKL